MTKDLKYRTIRDRLFITMGRTLDTKLRYSRF